MWGRHFRSRSGLELTNLQSSEILFHTRLTDFLLQEFKLDQVHNQLQVGASLLYWNFCCDMAMIFEPMDLTWITLLFCISSFQAARSRFEQANKLCHQFLNGNSNNRQLSVNQSSKDAYGYNSPAEREQSSPVMYSGQVSSFPDKSATEVDSRKSAAAEVAAKLTSSTSSAQMLSYVLSSLASEGVIGNQGMDSPPEKRAKVKADNQASSAYIPLPPDNAEQPPPPPFSPFPQSEPLHTDHSIPLPPTCPPPMPPPLPPMPLYPMQPPPSFMPLSGPTNGMPYYGISQLQPPLPPSSMPSYTPISGGLPPFTAQPPLPPAGSFSGFPGSDGNLYSQPSSVPTAPISRQ